jgi:hypothetical protein
MIYQDVTPNIHLYVKDMSAWGMRHALRAMVLKQYGLGTTVTSIKLLMKGKLNTYECARQDL